MTTQVYETHSADETFLIGKRIGEKCQPFAVIALVSDLAGGKTALTKGIAAGLGIEKLITSPTFTLLHEYQGGRLPLYHFDVYRIGDLREMDELGFSEYLGYGGVVVIEWADLIKELLPPDCMNIVIEKDITEGADYRRITIQDCCEIM